MLRSRFKSLLVLSWICFFIIFLSSVFAIPYLTPISTFFIPNNAWQIIFGALLYSLTAIIDSPYFTPPQKNTLTIEYSRFSFESRSQPHLSKFKKSRKSGQKKSPPAPLVNVEQSDWEAANSYFATDTNGPKLDKRIHNLKKSFIKINNEIYAIKEKPALGAGGEGKVKIVQNQLGNNYTVKIEHRGERGPNDEMVKVLTYLNMFKGEAQRTYMKLRKNKLVESKLYTVSDYKEGKDLFQQFKKIQSLSTAKKFIIAIKCAQALKELHDKNIVHGDIKANNFVGKIEKRVNVSLIDFNFSKMLPSGKSCYWATKIAGTPHSMAPEIKLKNAKIETSTKVCTLNLPGQPPKMVPMIFRTPSVPYSKASDIYALGIMFERFLGLVMPAIGLEEMTSKKPEDRLDIDQVIAALFNRIENVVHLDKEFEEMIDAYDSRCPQSVFSKAERRYARFKGGKS